MQHIKKNVRLIIFVVVVLGTYIYLNFVFDFFNTSGKGYDELSNELTRLEKDAERMQDELDALNKISDNFKTIKAEIDPIINQINLKK